MDHSMIQLWNSRVSADDDVYIVGDFCHKSDKSPDWYLRQLRGHKHADKGDVCQLMKTREHALNAAACINHYMPASINDLIRNNKEFQEKDAESADLLFMAKNKVTGEQFLFSFTDLYGYEGEVCGILEQNEEPSYDI